MPANHLKKPGKRTSTIRLALDQVILKEGLRALIDSDQGLCCLDEELGSDPDVTVIDLSDNSAVEKIRRLGSPSEVKFVVLTEVLHSTAVEELVKSGARAVVAKTTDGRILLNALRIVADGGRWLDPKLIEASGPKAHSPMEQRACWESLTNRELEVASLMLRGAQADAIGRTLGVSHHTVHSHRRNIFRKLNIHSRLELARYWSRQGGPGEVDEH
jgi:DNA-binding NarL/FixJ family response regulator